MFWMSGKHGKRDDCGGWRNPAAGDGYLARGRRREIVREAVMVCSALPALLLLQQNLR